MENSIYFDDVSFSYPMIEGDLDENGKQIVPSSIFEHFTGKIPFGFTSLVGPNGCGKSTFLMLASGRLVPQSGKVLLCGQDVASLQEEQKNLLASVIYQNMEFETDESVANLLHFVYQNGALKGNAKAVCGTGNLFDEVLDAFELENLLSHKLTALSKGEIQRVLLGFSILYGSASIFMDEPLFAMEDRQKNKALSYLKKFSAATKTAIFISMHELDLTRKFADNVLLIYPNRDMSYGTPEEVLCPEDLEKAYGIPTGMLKNHEDLTRENLISIDEQVKKINER